MVVQKKKKPIPPVRKCPGFVWTPQRKQAALLISEGTKNYEDIALEVGVEDRTLRRWRQSEVFLDEVGRLTLSNERATKEGLLRLSYKAIEEKIGNLRNDKNTALDWAKFISELQGHVKKQVELDANMKHSTEKTPQEMTDEELKQAINDDLKTLVESGYIPN